MVMNDELKRMSKKSATTKFKVLPWPLSGGTEKNREKSVRIREQLHLLGYNAV
jgi:hypothetical protein